MSHLRRVAAFAGAALVAATAIACAGPATTASPAASARPGPSASPASAAPAASPTPPIPGLSWQKAPDVERPTDAFAEPSAEPTGPSGPGTASHPATSGQAIVDDVVATDDGLTAVGYVGIDGVWTAIAWRSRDGERWTLESIDEAPASFAVAVATDPRTGRVYAAGRSGPDPVVWAATGGGDWTRTGIPTLSGGAEWERAVAIVATRDGLLVGGSVGPELGDRRARFWRSTDGALWEAVPDDPAFAGAEVVAIEAARRRRLRRARPSRDRPAEHGIGRLALGRRRRVAARSTTRRSPAAWPTLSRRTPTARSSRSARTSTSGRPSSGGRRTAARRGGGRRARTRGCTRPYKIRMTDVVATPGGLVAVGNYVGLQYGTAASWLATSWEIVDAERELPRARPGRDAPRSRAAGPASSRSAASGRRTTTSRQIWLSDLPGG